MAWHLDVHSLI